MEENRPDHIAENENKEVKTKEDIDVSPSNSFKGEQNGISKIKRAEQKTLQFQDNTSGDVAEDSNLSERAGSRKNVRISETGLEQFLEENAGLSTQVMPADTVDNQQTGGISARWVKDGNESDSELSDVEQPGQDAAGSDYDTDLEMDDNKWLHPEKYEHDTTGLSKYLKACRDEGVQPVRTFLNNMLEEHLVLKHHGLGPSAVKALSVPLQNNTSIETIDLEGNWIMAEGTAHICRVLRENVYVTRLNLSENKLGNEGAMSVCALLLSNKNIDHVNLAGNEIGNPTIDDFYAVLTQSGSILKHLSLRHNNFDDAAAQKFKEALIENETLEFLDLSWNNFQNKGCVLLAEGLKENVGLKELAVSMNGFDLEGGKALGKALQSNRTLYKLDASYCRLPIECIGEIALGLMNNDKLGVLDISHNCMDAESALVILLGLEKNDSSELLFLELGNTRVNLKFKEVGDKLNAERGLVIQHGGVKEDYKTQISEEDPMEAFKRDPMTKLKEWLSNAGYRLIDLMRTFDKDQSMTISIQEFRAGIASTKIPLSEEQLQILINKLDKDGDGEIDFSELVEGDKTHRQNKREIDKYKREKEKEEREKANEEMLTLQSVKKKNVNTEEKDQQETAEDSMRSDRKTSLIR